MGLPCVVVLDVSSQAPWYETGQQILTHSGSVLSVTRPGWRGHQGTCLTDTQLGPGEGIVRVRWRSGTAVSLARFQGLEAGERAPPRIPFPAEQGLLLLPELTPICFGPVPSSTFLRRLLGEKFHFADFRDFLMCWFCILLQAPRKGPLPPYHRTGSGNDPRTN